jgi:hypothetical protein
LEERALLNLDIHLVGRRTGPLLVRGAFAALLAFGSLSSVVSNAMAKTLTGSSDSASTTAVVAHSDNGVRMRTAAGGDVLDIFPDGTKVTLRTGVEGTVVDSAGVRWWPVVVYGENGWIAGDYLDDDPTSAAATTSSSKATSADASSGEFATGSRCGTNPPPMASASRRSETATWSRLSAAR